MPDTALAFADHDHRHCRAALLEELRRVARSRGLRLTPARVRVLEILSEAHRAMGAYEILDRLKAEGLGAQPPVAYRALEFLILYRLLPSGGGARPRHRRLLPDLCHLPQGGRGRRHRAGDGPRPGRRRARLRHPPNGDGGRGHLPGLPQRRAGQPQAMTEPLVEAVGLGVSDGPKRILFEVGLTIRPGEIVTIVGPNGAGKTTLLRALIGALKPSHGVVRRRHGLTVGYTPQRLAIDRTMPLTVDRFLALGALTSRDERTAALETVGLGAMDRVQVTDLSGGELQRAALARALLRRPDLLVLDEPTQGLDQPGEAAFYRLIEQLRRDTGAAICMVSHDLHVVMSASDRVICLNGHICCEGAPFQVSEMPEYRALFGFGTRGALALYRHEHDHRHEHGHHRGQDHDHGHAKSPEGAE
jgi:zinc transport system ATP-binding protein